MAEKKGGRPLADKTPYVNSAVARIRTATGMGKKEFAALCGIKNSTYQTIEKRGHESRAGVSAKHAYQIAAATGASPGHLRVNQARARASLKGYTKEDFERHRETFRHVEDERKAELIRIIQDRYDDIIDHLDATSEEAFLAKLFALAFEIEMLAAKFGVTHDRDGKKLAPLIEEVIDELSEGARKGGINMREQIAQWKIVEFSERMRAPARTARIESKLSPVKRKLKSEEKRASKLSGGKADEPA